MTPPTDMAKPAEKDPLATALYLAVEAELFGSDSDGASADASAPHTPEASGYELRALIARGRMGEVYRAWEPALERTVALKFVRTGSPSNASRLDYEARLLSKCPHPNIVHVYRVVPYSDTQVFLAMEYVEGNTLDAWLRTRRTANDILRCMLAVGQALAAAHKFGVIHRDVKPNNIMIDDRGHAKLIDFGLADVLCDGAANTSTPSLVGTHSYIAPEHLAGEVCTSQSDQYSFCVVLFQALYATTPLGDPVPWIVGPAAPRPSWSVRRALLRGLQYHPKRRWPTMDHLLQALTRRPWWAHPVVVKIRLTCFLCSVLALTILGVLDRLRTRENERDHATCVSVLKADYAQIQDEARRIGMSAVMTDNRDESLCRAAHLDRDDAQKLAVAQRHQCLTRYAEALAALAPDLQREPNAKSTPLLRHLWTAVSQPLPPLAVCSELPSVMLHPEVRTSVLQTELLQHLMQVRLLLQEQLFAEAREIFDHNDLIARLERLGATSVLAEALLYAGQIARRYQQQLSTVRIHGLDAEELLSATEFHAEAADLSDLVKFIRIERVNLMLDQRDPKHARMEFARTPNPDDRSPELWARHVQAAARLAAFENDLPRTFARLRELALGIVRHPQLLATTIPVELLAAAAIHTADSDPQAAYALHRLTVEFARARLGPHHFLSGIITANAGRHAFVAGHVDEGEQWLLAALDAFHSAFGDHSHPLEQLEYDLTYNLLMAGESARAAAHADLTLGHARRLGIADEVTFTLSMRSLIELRTGRFDAARSSAAEALASISPALARLPGYAAMLEVAALTVEAERPGDPALLARVEARQHELTRPGAFAFDETLHELRYLRARLLAHRGALRPALAQLEPLTADDLQQIGDRLTRADIHLLRGHLHEQLGAPASARAEACLAYRLLVDLGTDGQNRISAFTTHDPSLLAPRNFTAATHCPP